MGIFESIRSGTPDISGMKVRRDIKGLIKALRHPDIGIQGIAAGALGQMGPEAVDELLIALRTRNKHTRLGIIEALGQCRDNRAIPAITACLHEEDNEIRWEAALALGEVGDIGAVAELAAALHDPDKYVRYGASLALLRIGYLPPGPEEKAYLSLGLQDWEEMVRIGHPALGALGTAMDDRDPAVRVKVTDTLARIGSPDGIPLLYRALRDKEEDVRWAAVQAGPKCGIDLLYLPRGLSKRPRIRKNPNVAAFLNFVLPGLGYFYIGKWWGILIFQADVYVTLWLFSHTGEIFTYNMLYPVYAILAIHGWYMARQLPDL
ncbi:MAG: HEAT repeat domain-containing protein [Methanoregulaceae archaeon]|nr:HEAT repeat domain-containing protein [Methanoregulaceae archaeon]